MAALYGGLAMLFVVRFTDHPERLAVRQAQLPAHLAWLEDHRDTVLVGGSLRVEPNAPAEGGLWVVEAPDKASVEALLVTDPFWLHGLRSRYEILHWSKAFPDRSVAV
jgi:uncharacterized protein YciI